MLNEMIVAMLLIFSADAERDYERCIKTTPCIHDDNPGLNGLSKEEKQKAMFCRIGRHLKCSEPEKDKL